MKETQAFIRKLKSESSQSNFDTVKGIISAMNSNEVRFAKSYLMLLHTSEFESQSLRLFRYIQQHPDHDESRAREHFTEQGGNFDKIVSTLKKRLGWSLVSEYNTQRDGAYSYKWKSTFEVMSNLMLYHVLIARGLSGHAFDLLNDTIRTAREIEAFPELKNALELKIRHIRLRSENRPITRVTKELEHCILCDNALSEAKEIYYELGTVTRKLGHRREELIAHAQENLKRLQQLHEQTQSDNVLYYLLFAKATLSQLQKDFRGAGKIFTKLHETILASPALNSTPNTRRISIDLANNHLYQGNFEITLAFCKKAKAANMAEGSYNYFQVEFLEFYSYFYTNQFYLAERKIFGILEHPNYTESEYLVNTKKYLAACTLFAQEKYQEALHILQNLEKVWSDTTGWNVGIRTLIMLCYKMLCNYELMALERERFRALFDKYRHRAAISSRDKIILKIIHEFLKQNSDFKSIFQRKLSLFNELKQPDNKWQIMSHEMIVFDQWFLCMMNRTKYRSDF